MRWLEDFTPGQIFTAGPMAVEHDEAVAFAGRYDPQDFHLEEEAGKASVFGGLAASGWLTGCLTMRMFVDCGLDIAGGLIGRGIEVSWPRPVLIGDTLTVTVEVTEVRPSSSGAPRGSLKLRTLTRNQRDEVVQEMNATLIVPTRAAALKEAVG